MQINRLHLTIFIVFSSLLASAGTTFKATTTLAAETANNTSAAQSFVPQTNGNLGGANISKVPTRSLLYPGSTAKIYAHFVPWFGFGDHMNVGYVSSDTLQVQKQVNDMAGRGLDGAVVDWYGRGESSNHFLSYDQASQAFMHQAELHPGFNFAIMHDAGALKTCATTVGCDVTQTLIDDLNYLNVTYANSPAYLYSAGRPVVYFFGHEAYGIDWTRVRAGVGGNPLFIFRNGSGFTKAQSGGAFSWVEPTLVSPTDLMSINYLDGYYKTARAYPAEYSTGSAYKGFNDTLALWGTNRIIDQQCGQTWLQTIAEAGKFYSTTSQMPGIQLVTWNDYEEGTEIETGIDNCVTVSASVAGTMVSWGITGQINTVDHFSVYTSQDGANLMWLADAPVTATSLNLAQFSLNAGNYIIFVKATGQPSLTNKISTGVQLTVPNLPPTAALSVTTPAGSVPANSPLPLPITITASTAGSTDVDGTIVASSINFGDGSAAVNGPSASHTYSAAGTYTITATVTDNLGAANSKSVTLVLAGTNQPPVAAISATPGSAYAPATVSASAAASSDPDGTIASSVISFGDGTTANGIAASHSYSTAGVYTLTAKVTDNQGASSSASTTVTIKAPEVIVSSPASGASVPSQVHIVASAFSGWPVTAMQIYVDSALTYVVGSANLDTTIALASGTHTLIVKGWDSAGNNFSKSMNVTATNQPPLAALSITSGSILVGGSIAASTSGSSDPDGSIASTVISFGDGASATAVSASHQYKLAGTYTVTATVTDNLGASSTATATVVVKPPFVTIASPTVTSTTSTSVRAAGTASSGYPVVATQVYLDGVLKYQSANNTADTTLPIAFGTHQLVIQGWDASGATFKSVVTITRQ
ncbi:MAG TPA: PKD domain-containing protein [Candidatus Angelobacter sp.]|nr:PKD domain-containing protein [Candidatus Angelobacter sp.]